MPRTPFRLGLATLAALAVAAPCAAAQDVRVTSGSPSAPFSQNKQNEPAVAIDARHPNVLAAGANDEIDMEACNAGDPGTCPFTPDVGSSGVYFSFNGGKSWAQPTYRGLTGRDCLGPAECTAHPGPIGTLPRYDEVGLVSDGDPAVAFGPRRGADGTFSWDNGSRLYYANLASSVSSTPAFKGYEAIAVSRTDDPARAARNDASAWKPPVIVSKQSSTTFSDKEQIWADNAASSKYFGHVYVCSVSFRSNGLGNGLPVPLVFARSSDGGDTWTTSQLTKAATNANDIGRDGCTVRTASNGDVYVFFRGTDPGSMQPAQLMLKSTDGGEHFTGPTAVAPAVAPGVLDPVILRPVMDGLTGARADLSPAPSVDIANGAPNGTDATNQIAVAWADRGGGLNAEKGYYSTSRNGGGTWTPRTEWTTGHTGDRPYFVAPAFSPDGSDLYLSYNAFTTRYRGDTTTTRGLAGGVRHANVDRASGAVGTFGEVHRGVTGDPRGSSQNDLAAEFLGDYVYAAATNDAVAAVWNDVRYAADCPAIDRYRQKYADAVRAGTIPPDAEEDGPAEAHREAREAAQHGDKPADDEAGPEPPAVQSKCPPRFGNSDVYGGSWADPTP